MYNHTSSMKSQETHEILLIHVSSFLTAVRTCRRGEDETVPVMARRTVQTPKARLFTRAAFAPALRATFSKELLQWMLSCLEIWPLVS